MQIEKKFKVNSVWIQNLVWVWVQSLMSDSGLKSCSWFSGRELCSWFRSSMGQSHRKQVQVQCGFSRDSTHLQPLAHLLVLFALLQVKWKWNVSREKHFAAVWIRFHSKWSVPPKATQNTLLTIWTHFIYLFIYW